MRRPEAGSSLWDAAAESHSAGPRRDAETASRSVVESFKRPGSRQDGLRADW